MTLNLYICSFYYFLTHIWWNDDHIKNGTQLFKQPTTGIYFMFPTPHLITQKKRKNTGKLLLFIWKTLGSVIFYGGHQSGAKKPQETTKKKVRNICCLMDKKKWQGHSLAYWSLYVSHTSLRVHLSSLQSLYCNVIFQCFIATILASFGLPLANNRERTTVVRFASVTQEVWGRRQ